ncbi:MAG: carboxypeptidase regulatory-like domain-containing protein, partial [bacterium]
LITYSISGTITYNGAGLPGVTVSAGGISATTNSNGSYTISNLGAGTYTITPSIAEYSFSPPPQNVTVGPSKSNINFTATKLTYSISGTITHNGSGLQGVVVSAGGNQATTASNGSYTITGLAAGSYIVTPTLAEYTFSPPTQNVAVGPNAAAINFAATQNVYSISGTITNEGAGLPGVTVSAGGKQTTTASNGSYTISDLPAGLYSVIPSKDGYIFSPSNRSVSLVSDTTGINFTTTLITYSISGTITYNGAGLPGVTVSAGGISATTNSNGSYTISNLGAGTYTIIPSIAEYSFSPSNQNVAVGPSKTNINFTATKLTYSISGTITHNGSGLQGVVVSAGGNQATTAANGSYTISNLVSGTYTIIPSHNSYTFDPLSRTLNLQNNLSNVDFEASVYTPPIPEIDHFEISLLSEECIIDMPVTLSIKALDQNGNIFTSCNETINVLITNGSSVTKTAAITNGRCVLELTVENFGSKVTISVDNAQGKTSNDIELTFVAPETVLSGFNLSFNNQSYKPGDALELTVQALDNNNNKFTSYSYDNITVKSNIGTVSPAVISLTNGEAMCALTVDTKLSYAVTVEIWLEIDGTVMSNSASLLVQPSSAASSEEICVFPNPVSVNGSIQFSPLPDSSSILIYTISGSLVREVNLTESDWTWDLTNEDRSNIAPGVYIYVIKTDDSVFKKGKVAILPK